MKYKWAIWLGGIIGGLFLLYFIFGATGITPQYKCLEDEENNDCGWICRYETKSCGFIQSFFAARASRLCEKKYGTINYQDRQYRKDYADQRLTAEEINAKYDYTLIYSGAMYKDRKIYVSDVTVSADARHTIIWLKTEDGYFDTYALIGGA